MRTMYIYTSQIGGQETVLILALMAQWKSMIMLLDGTLILVGKMWPLPNIKLTFQEVPHLLSWRWWSLKSKLWKKIPSCRFFLCVTTEDFFIYGCIFLQLTLSALYRINPSLLLLLLVVLIVWTQFLYKQVNTWTPFHVTTSLFFVHGCLQARCTDQYFRYFFFNGWSFNLKSC